MNRKYVYFFGGRQGRRQGRHERPAGRQGRQPRRDDQDRPARAGRASRSPPRSAPTSTPTAASTRRSCKDQVAEALQQDREDRWGRSSATRPTRCCSSCRSGARDSMPGMMDTVLNIGLNDTTVQALAKQVRQRAVRPRLLSPAAADVRRSRAWASRATRTSRSSTSSTQAKQKQGVKLDNELTSTSLKKIIAEYKAAIKKYTGKDFPEEPATSRSGTPSAPCSARG